MTDLAKLPVTVITGFLGSGKTTLITHLMQNPGGKRLAVVVNEFGDVGVDGEILKGCAIPDCPAENIMELANGCICCTVADDKITVDGVIALADAEAVASGRFAPDVAKVDAQRLADDSLDHETPLSEVFEDQISCADIILLTKPDLAGPEGVAKAKEIIAAEAPRPLPVIEVAEGAVDPRVILGLEAAAEDDMDARPSHHDDHDDHEHDDFESIVVEIPEVAEPGDLVARIEELANSQNILRVKGYASVTGKPMRLLVQAVGARVRHQYDRPWKAGETRRGRLVVIAEHDDVRPEAIQAVLGVATEAAE